MHIDQIIETLSNTVRQSTETKFILDYLERKKSQGVTEMNDDNVLEVMNYMANVQEQTNIQRINESREAISHHLTNLEQLQADDVLSGLIRTIQKAAISSLRRQVDSDEEDNKPSEIKKAILNELKLDEKITNLPSSVKQEMLVDYGHKLFDELKPEDLEGIPYYDEPEEN